MLANEITPFVSLCLKGLVKTGNPIASFRYFVSDFSTYVQHVMGIREGCHVFWWYEANGEYHIVLHNGHLVFSRFLSQGIDIDLQGIAHTVAHVSHTLHVHIDGIWQIGAPGEGKIDMAVLFPKAATSSPLMSFLQSHFMGGRPIYCKPLFLEQFLYKFSGCAKICTVFLGAFLAGVVLYFYTTQTDMLHKIIVAQKGMQDLTRAISKIDKELPERKLSLKEMRNIQEARQEFHTLKKKQADVSVVKTILSDIWSSRAQKFVWEAAPQQWQVYFKNTQEIPKKWAQKFDCLGKKYGNTHIHHTNTGAVVEIRLVDNRGSHAAL